MFTVHFTSESRSLDREFATFAEASAFLFSLGQFQLDGSNEFFRLTVVKDEVTLLTLVTD